MTIIGALVMLFAIAATACCVSAAETKDAVIALTDETVNATIGDPEVSVLLVRFTSN